MTKEQAWTLIDKIGWGTKTTDYNAIEHALMRDFDLGEMIQFRRYVDNWIGEVASAIQEAENDNLITTENHWRYSDDGFDDFTAHIVGMGKEMYELAISDPVAVQNEQYSESFRYCIPTKDEYRDHKKVEENPRYFANEIENAILCINDLDIGTVPYNDYHKAIKIRDELVKNLTWAQALADYPDEDLVNKIISQVKWLREHWDVFCDTFMWRIDNIFADWKVYAQRKDNPVPILN